MTPEKPWMVPPQYNEADAAIPPPAPAPLPPPALPAWSVRTPRPPFRSLDTDPLVYRKGDPNAVFGLDDDDEGA